MSGRKEEGYIRQSFALLKGWMLRSAALSLKGIKKILFTLYKPVWKFFKGSVYH